jgi:replication factor A2
MGLIREIKKQSTNHTYTIEDGSGSFDVKLWVQEETSKMVFNENEYVEFYGKLADFNGAKHVLSHNMKRVTDMNQLTHHLVDCIYHYAAHKERDVSFFPNASSKVG